MSDTQSAGNGVRHRVGRSVHRLIASAGRREGPVAARLARLARTYLRAHDGASDPYDMDGNGERLLLERLGPHLDVVFDVGANVGDWSAIAVEYGARAVHAFEIAPTTAGALRDRFVDSDVVDVHAIGLGEIDGVLTIHHYPDAPQLTTTMTQFSHEARLEALDVPVRRADGFAAAHGIVAIDLVKVDVEGAEPSVLRGFGSLLADGRIGAIQFEYGVVAVVDRFLMADFYDLLSHHGYEIGPLRADGVAFQDYNLGLERFDDVNFVAVHRSRPDLRAAVSRPG